MAISGYLLGGGLGWNSERWGLGCHNFIDVDVVTADGELRRVSADEDSEIYWAARGAGPAFFCVVTRYRLALHPLPRAITTSTDALADRTIGHYVGEADLDRPGRLRACFSPEAWDRLQNLRARYDPAGVFDRTRDLSDAKTNTRPHATAVSRTAT